MSFTNEGRRLVYASSRLWGAHAWQREQHQPLIQGLGLDSLSPGEPADVCFKTQSKPTPTLHVIMHVRRVCFNHFVS